MATGWQYTRAFHRRLKNDDDPRVEQAYADLQFLLRHAKSDALVSRWLGVSPSTIARWKSHGFGPIQLDAHYPNIEATREWVEGRLEKELRKAGPDAELQIRPTVLRRPGPTESGFPGALHVFIEGGTLAQMWHYMKWAQSQHYPNGEPVYEAFYLTIRFGSQYKGKFWDGDEVVEKPKGKNASGVWLQKNTTANTRLARECADLHPFDEPWIYFYPQNYKGKWHSKPKRGGNNLTLYECLTNHFYQQNATIERIVFIERKPDQYRIPF